MYGSDFIRMNTHLYDKWGVESFYWHPLYRCDRPHLIALYKSYWEDEVQIRKVVGILMSNGVERIIEIRGDESISSRKLEVSELLWNSDDYFWNNEAFWFDESYEWLIYISHEGSITFGGEWLVYNVKDVWAKFIDDLRWDCD